MIDALETLIVLGREGTITKTATKLRVTQSAVSKRISSLEGLIGENLIEKSGRGVTLTGRGQQLISDTGSLVGQLRSALTTTRPSSSLSLTIGVAESVFCSWGAKVLYQAATRNPGVKIFPHTHRSPTVLDLVRSGEYMLGFCGGLEKLPSGVIGEVLILEPMVLVGKNDFLADVRKQELWSIEPQSATWRSLQSDAAKLGFRPSHGLETFFGVAQAAMSGFCVGLVPIGVARALRFPPEMIRTIEPSMKRPISIIGQKSLYNKAVIHAFADELAAETAKINFD